MLIEHRRYPDPPGLLRLRLAVVVTDRGLLEEFRLGGRRLTLWCQLRGVRWLRHGVAEVQRVDGRVIRLPEGLDDIDELVDTIEAEAAETQALWREHGVPESLMCEWLRIEPGTRWDYDPNPGMVAGGGAMVVLGLLALFVGMDYAAPVLLWLLFSAGVLIAGLMGSQDVITATTREVVRRHGTTSWSVAWHDVRSVEVTTSGGKDPTTTIRLLTRDGKRELSGPASAFAPLAETAQHVAEANTARFAEAGDEPIPDTALSFARMAESPDAERGLSQSEG